MALAHYQISTFLLMILDLGALNFFIWVSFSKEYQIYNLESTLLEQIERNQINIIPRTTSPEVYMPVSIMFFSSVIVSNNMSYFLLGFSASMSIMPFCSFFSNYN